MIHVVVNGDKHAIAQPCTVADFIGELDLSGKFAVEINETIVPRSDYQQALITEGDRIEIVQAIGGG